MGNKWVLPSGGLFVYRNIAVQNEKDLKEALDLLQDAIPICHPDFPLKNDIEQFLNRFKPKENE